MENMANLLSNAAHVATRHRSSSNASTTLPPHPAPEHTNQPGAASRLPHSATAHHQRSSSSNARSSQHYSNSAPSFFNIESGDSTPSSTSPEPPATTSLTIEFEGGTHVIVRPNRVVRGKVVFDVAERMHVTRIRIKFRAEESAMVKVEEGGGDTRGEWVHQAITTFFETDWKLWGNDASPYSQCAWEELEAGRYEFPFALKFPNVNYPPSMEEPPGFAIRYIWTAQADGPGLLSGTRSREYITPYRPIIISTSDKEWVYRTTLMRDKKHALVEAQAKLYKQSYCPDEPFEMQLNLTTLHAEAKITGIEYKFQKHHEGKMLVQQGTAFREHIRTVLSGTVPISKAADQPMISETVRFDVPTRLVSPSFISRHTRVHYGLLFLVTVEHGHLFKTSHVLEFSIPLTIANLPHDHLLRIPELTAIQNYRDSKECPIFFDPSLDEPPPVQGVPSEWIGPLTAALTTSPQNDEPPNYFSLPNLPPQLEVRKERKERTVFLSRPAKGAYNASDLSDAVIVPGLFDEDW